MKKIIKTCVAVALLAGLSSCSSSDDDPTDAGTPEPTSSEKAAQGDDRVFPTGQKLSHYKGSQTYPWRVNIVDNQQELLAKMQAIAPHLEEKDFTDVLNTCMALAGELPRGTVDEQAVVRFSGGSGEQVGADQAADLVTLSEDEVCPE
jgi:hypothetical protein